MLPETSSATRSSDEISHWITDFCHRHGLENRPAFVRDLKDVCSRVADHETSLRLLQIIEDEFQLIADPPAAMTGLDRLLALDTSPRQTILNFTDNRSMFRRLLQLMGTSPFFNQILFSQPEIISNLSAIVFQSKEQLLCQAVALTAGIESEKQVSNLLRRFRQRMTLSIASADFFDHVELQQTTRAISDLADVCIQAALSWAIDRNKKKFGMPTTHENRSCRLVALALGKLGGQELNYSSDVDLVFIYDDEGQTPGNRPLPAREFFGRVISDFLRVMAGQGGTGFVLRVDLRLRPEGMQGPVVMNLDQTLNYYDSAGRTWERQALIKVRPCAGDVELGEEFKLRIEPFVFRRYLNSIEIAEIQAMKRRIEHRSHKAGASEIDVKTGFGGIRDVEFVVQFLQLLNGCTLSQLRCNNTLQAIDSLRESACLTESEHVTLRDNYIFLRKIEHRIQLMDDRQTHSIPSDRRSRFILARLMGYHPLNSWENPDSPFERFSREYQKVATENHEILNKLLHDTFRTDEEKGPDLLTDLILDPEMPAELVQQALAPIGFKNSSIALKLLADMSREEKPFFSTPRCRHFFAALAPLLLNTISNTIDPDLSLANIEMMSRPVAGKVALWERLLRSPAALNSFVEIASYKKLTTDLISSRTDAWEEWSEFVDHHASPQSKRMETELLKTPTANQTISQQLKLFRDKNWLRISTALEIPLKIESTAKASRDCADLARSIVSFAAGKIWSEKLQQWRSNQSAEPVPGNWAVIALGKLGGQELLFHSDIDLLFLHEINPQLNSEKLKQSAEAFFQEIAGKLIRVVGETGNSLVYRIDTRLRPYGNSGPLSVSLQSLTDYYTIGDARVWEKLALLRSQPIFLKGFDENHMVSVLQHQSFGARVDSQQLATEIQNLRRKTVNESEITGIDLKRATGGLHEAELIVQGLQLSGFHLLVEPPANNFLKAVDQLAATRMLAQRESQSLRQAYLFYRMIELSLRLLRNRATHSVEIQSEEIPILENMICDQSDSSEMPFMQKIAFHRSQVNQIFQERFSAMSPPKVSAII